MMQMRNLFAVVALTVTYVAGSNTSWAQNCSGSPESPEVTLMGDWLPWASQGPFIAADIAGYYKDEGLTFKLIAPANPADPIKLVARNRVQFSLTYVPEIMISRDTAIPVTSVATTLRVLSSGLFFKSDSGIKTPADLKGKTLGVGPKLDAQAYLASVLAAGGLTKADVTIVDPGFSHVPMLLAGKIDAAHGLTYSEGLVADEELAKEHKPPVSWFLYRSYGVPAFYYQVLATNEDWAKSHPNTVCRFLRASLKGLDLWMAKPEAALTQIIKQDDAFTPEQHRKMYEATKSDWRSNGVAFRQDAKVWAEARDWALKQKLITVGEDESGYFTNAYLP
jgi:ABC-type nitrate/sulfonate/bicarbonate transport system substrate-binding protein